jgi:hypothetical protein
MLKNQNMEPPLSPSSCTAAAKYRATYDAIRRRLVTGNLIQVDETRAKIKEQDGYVWVFTSLQDVTLIYRATREANFLHEFLHGFTGVLVSDFYSRNAIYKDTGWLQSHFSTW